MKKNMWRSFGKDGNTDTHAFRYQLEVNSNGKDNILTHCKTPFKTKTIFRSNRFMLPYQSVKGSS